MRLTPAQVLWVYLHPRDEQGRLRFDPPGGSIPDEREQFRRYCLARGLTDPRTVERRYGEWRAGRAGARAAGADAGGEA